MTQIIKKKLTDEVVQIPGKEFLVFSLGGQEYVVDIFKVQEIRSYTENITPVTNMPSYFKGLIKIHNTIIPIIDLHILFQLQQIEYNAYTVLIILNYAKASIAILVDSVSDIILLNDDQIKQVQDLQENNVEHYIKGVGSTDERIFIILDLEKIMAKNSLFMGEYALNQTLLTRANKE